MKPEPRAATVSEVYSSEYEKVESVKMAETVIPGEQVLTGLEPAVIGEETPEKQPSIAEKPSVAKEPSVAPQLSVSREPSAAVKPSGDTSKEPSAVIKSSIATREPSTDIKLSDTTKPSALEEPSVSPRLSAKEPSVTEKPDVTSKEPSTVIKSSIASRESSDMTKPSAPEETSVSPELSGTREPSATVKPSIDSKEPSVTIKLSDATKPSVPEKLSAIPSLSATKEPSPTVRSSFTSKPSVKEELRITKEPILSVSPADQVSEIGPITEEPSEVVPSTELLLKEYVVVEPTPTTMVPAMLSFEGGTTTIPVTSPPPQIPSFTSDRPYKEERTGDFPFDVDTTVEILDVPPPDLNVTTTITASGTLEVITESPEGLIETTLNYKPDGTMEVFVLLHIIDCIASKVLIPHSIPVFL